MKVDLIASTAVHAIPEDVVEAGWHRDTDATSPDNLVEFAGRSCYQSWSRPNPETATNESYLANILSQQHFSVLEHASATFYITGVSRSLTHELIRHRHLSFSELSQRFVDMQTTYGVYPPAVEGLEMLTVASASASALKHYRLLVAALLARGLTRKQAREAARSVLPNCTETKIVVTGNMRAWRDVISKRSSPHADAEIQLLAKELLRQLKGIAPHCFQDMEI